MDYEIKFTGLRFYSKHGIYKWEKETSQLFLVDISITAILQETFNDDIEEVINYEEVFNEVKQVMNSNPINLVETLAKEILNSIKKFNPKKATVTIHKPETQMSKDTDDISVSLSKSFE